MMRRSILILVALIYSGLVTGSAGAQAEKALMLPPTSLAQWYKPANKRQVWLHNMFKLRRELQAVVEYASSAQTQESHRES